MQVRTHITLIIKMSSSSSHTSSEEKLFKKSKNDNSLIWEKIEAYLSILNHIIIGATTIYLSYVSYYIKKSLSRSLHVWLCLIGYQFLMAEAIMCYNYTNGWSRLHSRRTKTHLHWIMQLVGSVLSLVGCILEYINHSDDKEHFSTAHGITGLISMIFALIACFNGLSAFWSTELKKYVKPVYNKMFHSFIGFLAFFIGMISIIYSYDKNTIRSAVPKDAIVLLKIAAALCTALTVIGVFRTWYAQLRGFRFSA